MEGARSRSRSPVGTEARGGNSSRKRSRVSYTQHETLVGYLEGNVELARGQFSSGTQGHTLSQNGWQTITNILNAIPGGAHKDWKGWSQYWSQQKSKLKMKKRNLLQASRGTGGGPPPSCHFTDLDNRILTILGPSFATPIAGVQVIPEVCEEQSQPQPEPEEELSTVAVIDDNDSITTINIDSFLLEGDATASTVTLLSQTSNAHSTPLPGGSRQPPRFVPTLPDSPPAASTITARNTSNNARSRRRRRIAAPHVLEEARAAITEIERERAATDRQRERNMDQLITVFSTNFERLYEQMERLITSRDDQFARAAAQIERLTDTVATLQREQAATTRAVLDMVSLSRGCPETVTRHGPPEERCTEQQQEEEGVQI